MGSRPCGGDVIVVVVAGGLLVAGEVAVDGVAPSEIRTTATLMSNRVDALRRAVLALVGLIAGQAEVVVVGRAAPHFVMVTN